MKKPKLTRRSAKHVRAQRKLIDALEAKIARAYIDSVNDIKAGVNVSKLTERLAANDVEGAIAALNIEAAAFDPLRKALIGAYESGGKLAMSSLPTIVNVRR